MTGEINLKNINADMSANKNKIHPHKFALWVALGSIVMMFAGLTSAFIVKRSGTEWTDIKLPVVFYISTLVILLSSLTIQVALNSFKLRQMSRYRAFLNLTTLLGITFVVLQYFGFKEIWTQGLTLKTDIAASFVYVIVGLHALHILAGIVVLIVQFFRAFSKNKKSYSINPIEMTATYWHFVDALWIYLFLFFIIIRL